MRGRCLGALEGRWSHDRGGRELWQHVWRRGARGEGMGLMGGAICGYSSAGKGIMFSRDYTI
jgi:hypothetical protein